MARIQISKENQLERISVLESKMRDYQKNDIETLHTKPDLKSWNVLEVIEHMSTAQAPYTSKLDGAMREIGGMTGKVWEIVVMRRMASYVCQKMLPKDEVIKFKMKTSKKFRPVLPENQLAEERINRVFSRFYGSLEHLRSTINKYGDLPVEKVRFNSAIGPIVRFNVAEAVEFIISHHERHLVQIANTLKKNGHLSLIDTKLEFKGF